MEDSTQTVTVGSFWQRNSPRGEVVEVQRSWVFSGGGEPAVPTVRAHPIRGGKPLVAPIAWFVEHYSKVVSR